jgi:myo-inositol-1(or 4)-monophosphatase
LQVQRDIKALGADLLVACRDAAMAGARYIRRRERDRTTIDWEFKARADFVSEVDREAETRIATILTRRVPDAIIVGEELTPTTSARNGVAFVVDPLDGTTNFLHGYPQYAVSIAAVVDGQPVAGAIVHVPRGEVFTASVANGAACDGREIRVSNIADPARALIGTGFPFKHADQLEQYFRQMGKLLTRSAGIRRAGAAALDLADLAAGRFDAFWELKLAPWDFAAGVLLIREAGGTVTSLDGRAIEIDHTAVVASNGVLHGWLLEQLRQDSL